jgi:hypothetical protein
MKRLLVLAATAAMVLTSCKTNNPDPQPEEKIVTGLISEDTYWYADTVYEMAGKVVVGAGATLNIEAGTTILAREGQGSLSTALIVAQGGKIQAEGTADAPIVFTSIYDNGTNLDETDMGLWGGIVVLGYAPISADAATALIEGLPANEPFAVYGGSNIHDNSGVLKYVSIRHAGTLLGDGNELNGLTLGGVGSATVIDNIEVVGNLDDGIEFFGGTVNASNLLVWAQGDDAFDIDQAYAGIISNFVNVEGSESDHALEIDGPEGSYADSFVMENGILISDDGVEVHIRDGAEGTVSFEGTANVVADSGTAVTVTILNNVTMPDFTWTFTHSKGKL